MELTEELHKTLPKFVQNNVWAKIHAETCAECKKKPCVCSEDNPYKQTDHIFIGEEGLDGEIEASDCDVMTSLTHTKAGTEQGWSGFDDQKPVIDIDFPCALVPSTTEGHCHLYLDKAMSQDDLMKLLKVMSEVGIVEEGYYRACLARGYSSVRLPWVKKETADV